MTGSSFVLKPRLAATNVILRDIESNWSHGTVFLQDDLFYMFMAPLPIQSKIIYLFNNSLCYSYVIILIVVRGRQFFIQQYDLGEIGRDDMVLNIRNDFLTQ
jgi:hypothetical protein